MAFNYLYNEQIIVGKTIQSIKTINNDDFITELIFLFTNNTSCKFYHQQDCCENVYILKLHNLNLLEGATLTSITKHETHEKDDYHEITITTYVFTHTLGESIVVWHGSSNGYYSTSVYFKMYFSF